jgi:NADH-quinone oxidoreductase subunit C
MATFGADILDRVKARFGLPGAPVVHGILVLDLPAGEAGAAAKALRDEFGFEILLDVTAIDWPDRDPRFEVVWHFYSTRNRVRVRVKAGAVGADPVAPSLTALYGCAGIMERECHDMYGIRFEGNPDLRPILLYEGFAGHPLRKDYPKQKEQPLVPYREEAKP